jgi:exosortase
MQARAMMSNSAEAVPLLSTGENRWSSRLPRWQGLALLLLFAWLYASILAHLFLQWVGPHSDPNFQHGIFVPIFALFVLWQDRKRLQAIPSDPSWTGLPLVYLSLFLLIVGVLGADIFLPRVSLLLLLAALMILFQGWKFFRAVLFPWAFLILMIPIPALLINRVTFPLQLLASKLAFGLLELVNVPVLREGNLLTLAAMQLDVAEACSGIRSLLTLVTLAIIYGYLMEPRKWVRVVLAVAAVPIAVVANSFRVFGTGLLVQYGHAEQAEGFYHALSGMVIFAVALIMLFVVHRVISLVCVPKTSPKSVPVASSDATRQHLQERAAQEIPVRGGSLRFGAVAVPMLAMAIGLQAHSTTEIIPPHQPLSSLPSQIDGWTGTDETLDQETLDILGPGESCPARLRKRQRSIATVDQSLHRLLSFAKSRRYDPFAEPLPAGRGMGSDFAEVIQLTRPDGSCSPSTATWFRKIGRAATGVVLVSGAWPRRGQRVLRPSTI